MRKRNERRKNARNSVYGKMGFVFLTVSAMSGILFLADNQKEITRNKNGEPVVDRGQYGEGGSKQNFQVQIGEMEELITVEVSAQRYTQEELDAIFSEAEERLEQMILGENESLEEVRFDLNLITELPDTGIEITWQLDRYDLMSVTGELQQENLTEEGSLVKLSALLDYGDEKCEYQFYAKIYPRELNETEKLLQELKEEIVRRDEETNTQKQLILPESVEGEKVLWSYEKDFRAIGLWFLGVAMSLLVYALDQQKKKDEMKEREKQLAYAYPQLISKFTLYIRAGMTPKNAWYRMAEDYERLEKNIFRQEAYEEMVLTMREMRGGASEADCYERFGERCGLSVYRKFGNMLSQNLKKGTKGMAVLLEQEADNAFEERKSVAKELGEEAGTKMLLPMFLMLAVVLVMIIIPAFLTVQI